MTQNKIELLAPAGDWDSFTAAVENGADAVYMGGQLFNARQFASNFDHDQFKKALDYAHVRGSRIYLTMNTLISDDEMVQALDFAEKSYTMGVDGIIVQDLGFAGLLRKLYPGLDLHASTQMTVYNLEGVKKLEQLGFKRVVLARELSIEEISAIAGNTPLEIEAFIHGALCISYSGQCLMSSIIGGRRGNRGKCAQPCRLPYELSAGSTEGNHGFSSPKGKYLLSPKDLCSLNELEKVIVSGVKSLKIEGRMKSPEYVATVVGTYRKYMDKILSESQKVCIDKEDMKNLTQIFNRGGFSTGYLGGKLGKDMMCYEKPKNWGIYLGEILSYDAASRTAKIKLSEDLVIGDGLEVWSHDEESPGTVVSELKINGKNVTAAKKGEVVMVGNLKGRISKGNKVYKTSDKRLLVDARETFTGKGARKTFLTGKMLIKEGRPAVLTANDQAGNHIEVSGESMPEPAVHKPLSVERVREQLLKTGATPFEFSRLDVEIVGNIVVPISELNNIRRKALDEMESHIARSFEREIPEDVAEMKKSLLHFPGNSRNRENQMNISVLFYHLFDNFRYSALKANRIYLPFTSFIEGRDQGELKFCREQGMEVFAWLPSITRGNYDKLLKTKIIQMTDWEMDGLLIGNIGALEYAKELPEIKVAGDYSLNVFNSYTLRELSEQNLKGVTLSLELTLKQLQSLEKSGELPREAVVYGRIPVMTSEYCPVGSIAGGYGKGKKCDHTCTKGIYKLKDRIGMEFPVLCDRIDCRSTIMNTNVIFVPDSLDKIRAAGVTWARLNITDEEPEEVMELVEMHRDVAEHGVKALDRYDGLVQKIKGRGFTKGHFYRGV